MNYAVRRKGDRLRVQGRESHVTFFREDPTMTCRVRWRSGLRRGSTPCLCGGRSRRR